MIPHHALLSLTQDFACACSLSAGKCQAGIGKMSFCVWQSSSSIWRSLVSQGAAKKRGFCQFLWLRWKTEANFQRVSVDATLSSRLISLFELDKHNLTSAGISLPAKPTYWTTSFCVCTWPRFGSHACGTMKKCIKDLSHERIHPHSSTLKIFLVQS